MLREWPRRSPLTPRISPTTDPTAVMPTRSLITGGAGFIGSHLAQALLSRGEHVVVLDDFSTGRRENIATLTSNASYTLVDGTVEDAATVDRLVAEVDVVYHLASAVGVQLIVDEPVRTIRTIIR